MHLSRLFSLFILSAGLFCSCPVSAQMSDPAVLLEKTADEALEAVEKLRSLKFKAPVKKGVKDKSEISDFLDKRLSEEYSQEELDIEGKVLVKLGFFSKGFDYEEYFLKLMAEQVAGYYDQEEKTLFIASWLPAQQQKPTMVHELTHALQDQHFDIEKLLEDAHDQGDNDRTMALQALLEGDAMVVMLQDTLEPIKRHFSELPDLAFVMQTQLDSMEAQYEVFREAPSFIQQSLVFPYGFGASFMQEAWKKNTNWQSINSIYSDLPVSTEQIMHPEKYFGARDNPRPVKPIDPVAILGNDWNIVYQNVLGEFTLGLLLNQHLTEEHSRKSVTGWGGDQVIYLENRAGRDAAIVNTVWDTEEDAEKFILAMDTWFRKRYPDAVRENELFLPAPPDEPDAVKKGIPLSFSLTQDGEFYEIERDGRNVCLMIGLPEAYDSRWQSAVDSR